MKIKCSGCHEVMDRPLWDIHDCPAMPRKNRGESFEDYQKRCKAFAEDWRKKNKT